LQEIIIFTNLPLQGIYNHKKLLRQKRITGIDSIAGVTSDMPSKCKRYTIKMKLDIICSYEKSTHEKGLPSLAKEYGISRDTVRGWIAKKEEL